MNQIKKSLDNIVAHLSSASEEVKNEKCSSILKTGCTRINQGLLFKGYDGVAELFITHTHPHWCDDGGNKDKNVTLCSLLEYIEILADDKFKDMQKTYSSIPDNIIDSVWEEACLLIPACLEFTYLMRQPYEDPETGKTRFKKNFPSSGPKLSIVKMKSVWS